MGAALTHKPPESTEARKIADHALDLWNAGDQSRAELAWKRAAELGSTRSMINLGRNRLDVKDFSGASSWFMKAYKLGDVEAALLLAGTARLQGDDAGEEYWSWRASELGNTAVLVYLARQKATETESFDVGIMRSAADLGDFDACCALSNRHFQWEEFSESIQWGKRAISASSAVTALESLAAIHGLVGSAYATIGDIEHALEYVEKARSLAPDLGGEPIDHLLATLREATRQSAEGNDSSQPLSCPRCGASAGLTARFCESCGYQLTTDS